MNFSRGVQGSLAPLLVLLAACGGSPSQPSVPRADGTSPDAGAVAVVDASPAVAVHAEPRADASTVAPVDARPVPEPAHADRDFAMRLYATQRATKGNLFFSPASARVALAMVYAGARGETASQMATALGFGADAAEVGQHYGETLKGWNSQTDAKVKLNVVNRLWGQRDKDFLPAFLDGVSDRFAAPLERVDFIDGAEPSRAKINAWVDQKTEHLIQNLLGPTDITPATRLVLTNAIYFKGEWRSPFEKRLTSPQPFHATPAGDVRAPMMIQTGQFEYAELPEAKLLSLPYGAGSMSMLIVLPNDVAGIDNVEAALDAAWLEAATARMRPDLVSVSLPKFSMTARMPLSTALSALGMPLAFVARQADFSGIDGVTDPERRLFIKDVIQKAFVKLDEKGTEAAAATGVIMRGPPSAPPRPKTFRADHPFVYLIRDAAGNVLFMGRLSDPS